ncbi:MAG: NAD(P)-dependent glycerol-3-phosphate dehydrogenase [Dehalococcoidia bacterium]|nr:NAD(P)-dependent glycerol-3-phosphate dehydrogenase [Dehalococcoidia bacterium]
MSGQARPAAVIGTTSWGTTLALLLARAGADTLLWSRTEETARRMNDAGENLDRLPGFPFPENLRVTPYMTQAVSDADVIIVCVPSPTFRQNLQWLKEGNPSPDAAIVSATKGLDRADGSRMGEIFAQEMGQDALRQYCVISGPNLSHEVAAGLPSSAVVASADQKMAERAQAALTSSVFRVYTSTDVAGVELGGSLKNIVAIGAGMIDGMEFGDNAKAAFISRAIAEILRLGIAAGAQPLTFSGLAGVGDLVATCYSRLSRNRYVGEQLGRGRNIEQIIEDLNEVCEGYNTTPAAIRLAERLNVETPITLETHRVLYEGLNPREAIQSLMERPVSTEYPGETL